MCELQTYILLRIEPVIYTFKRASSAIHILMYISVCVCVCVYR